MKEYNKLVRDRIPQIIDSNGETPMFRYLLPEEYKKELDKKLQEEVAEYLEDDNIEELADIVEVIEAILKYKKISLEDFRQIKREKKDRRGGFDKKIFLERTLEREEKEGDER